MLRGIGMSDAVEDQMQEQAHEEHKPVGTFMVMGFMVLVIIALWVWVYGLLLTRG